MKFRTLTCVTAIVLFAMLATSVRLSAQDTRYKLIDIGTLGGPSSHGPGNQGSQLLNNAGVVVGSSDTSAPDPNAPNCFSPDCFLGHAFRWEDGVLTDLGTIPGGENSGANSINARGWIVGGSTTAEIDPLNTACGFQPLCPQFHGFVWKDEKIIDIGTLGEGLESNTVYINNAGAVVGFSTINTSPDPFSFLGAPIHAFIWRDGEMRDLGTLGGPDSTPSQGGCNNQRNDLVAGTSLTNSTPNPTTGSPTQHAFVWENGTMTDIPTLGGTYAFAQGANNQGQVIGQSNLTGDPGCDGSATDGSCFQHAFLWDHETLTDLEALGGSSSVANWINNAGDIVGGAATKNDESFHAALWRHDRIIDLGTLPGDCLSFALAINSKGQIVGQSFNCDTLTSRTVLWEMGSIIDLKVISLDPLDINDRGEITGSEAPPGCLDTNSCAVQAFLLIPCAGGQGCEGKDSFSPQIESPAAATTLTQRREMTKVFVARLRTRKKT